jgi:alpha-galactosidase
MNAGRKLRRRRVLQLLAGSVAGVGAIGAGAKTGGDEARITRVGDGSMTLLVDETLRTQVVAHRNGYARALTRLEASESLTLADGRRVERFPFASHEVATIQDAHGQGTQHRITGKAAGIEKSLLVTFYERHPGTALLRARYRNSSGETIKTKGWTVAAHVLHPGEDGDPGFWSFSGASHEDRRDWVQPVRAGFRQQNFMGMNASDYGGGTPVVDVWRRDAGLAVGHAEPRPKLVSLPVAAVAGGARVAVEAEQRLTLAPGDSFETPQCFIHVHERDYFASLAAYRELMADLGLRAPRAPEAAFEPIWCAWGYERNFTVAEVEGTLQKAKDLGLGWAVLDDGWQSSLGDWHIDARKFPRGDADMIDFVRTVRSAGMKPRLWLAPLAANPGTDLLHDHVDMLLLDRNGAQQHISWWNAFYLCPAYAPTVEYYRKLVAKILGEWDYAGLKLDGQHLNGVAPCYNPAHRHARPEESVEKLQEFWKVLYETAVAINPEAVVELCPCGTSFAFHNMAYMNQTPASDPESSWQIRHKGKSLKALMGAGASYAGDHVELSDHGDDFASTVGLGAVVSTKFTWPADTAHPTAERPPGGYVLTPQKEEVWQRWLAIYRDKMLPRGQYRGELYDIGFDKPEGHAIEREGRLYYAFYAERWAGPLELRGLAAGRYAVTDYVAGKSLGNVSASDNRLSVAFDRFLLLEAIPLEV